MSQQAEDVIFGVAEGMRAIFEEALTRTGPIPTGLLLNSLLCLEGMRWARGWYAAPLQGAVKDKVLDAAAAEVLRAAEQALADARAPWIEALNGHLKAILEESKGAPEVQEEARRRGLPPGGNQA
jgi:hypothetical protein